MQSGAVYLGFGMGPKGRDLALDVALDLGLDSALDLDPKSGSESKV